MEKLRNEMAQNPDNKYVQVVGDFLLDYLRKHPAELPADKTIKGSLDAMREEARKNQSGGVGVLTPDEGFEIVLRYFGFEQQEQRSQGLDVTLEDLLGG